MSVGERNIVMAVRYDPMIMAGMRALACAMGIGLARPVEAGGRKWK